MAWTRELVWHGHVTVAWTREHGSDFDSEIDSDDEESVTSSDSDSDSRADV